MTNHVHLLLTPKNAATVPKLVISLGRRYVQYINRQYRRTGTLWDGRYKSSLIQAATYLLTCMRYIEPNPVRAAMVDEPAHSRWTSYRANALGTGVRSRRVRGVVGLGNIRARSPGPSCCDRGPVAVRFGCSPAELCSLAANTMAHARFRGANAAHRTVHAGHRTVHAAFQAVEAPFRTSSGGFGSPGPCFRTSLARFRAVERRFRNREARD